MGVQSSLVMKYLNRRQPTAYVFRNLDKERKMVEDPTRVRLCIEQYLSTYFAILNNHIIYIMIGNIFDSKIYIPK